MRRNRTRPVRKLVYAAVLSLTASLSLSTSAQAEIGSVRVLFTKAALVAGVGGGRGILTFRGRDYPFKVSGMSMGATIGASMTKLVGRALNLRGPGDIAGTYSALGAGGALGGGDGVVQLQNGSGVILQLHGVKVGVELSLNLAGVTITMD